ncbi:serine/threonine-protein kinase Nek11 [Polymixia lowei]
MPRFQELEAHWSSQDLPPDNSSLVAKRYSVVGKLGQGSFGSVYLVQDTKATDGEPLKVLKEIPLGDLRPNETVRATQEAQLLSQLHHPNILTFYHSFLERDCFCLITEYCQDKDLDCKLEEVRETGRSLPETQVVDWLIQLLLGLHYMHNRRILHRDLKAKNVFLKQNLIKIGDFGVSCLLMGSCDLATTFIGTPYYMSPEILNHRGYDSKSDIWALGCILYEMCCLTHAFHGPSFLSVVLRIVEGEAPGLPSGYSQELNSLMQRMLDKQSSSRPSAAELLRTKFMEEKMQISSHHLSFPVSLFISVPHPSLHRRVDLQTLRRRRCEEETMRRSCEEETMTPRERMRLRKLQAADQTAWRLRQFAEQKYQEVNRQRQELRSRHFEKVSLDVLNQSTGDTSQQTLPITTQDYQSLEGSQPIEKQHSNRMCLSEPALHDIPEDPQTADDYYNQEGFESCSDEEEEEIIEHYTSSETLYQSDPQDSDLEAMMRHMEEVLEGELSGGATAEEEALSGPPGPPVNSSLVETRIQRMRESLCGRLGVEVFQKAYDYRKEARERCESEARMVEGLSDLVERPSDAFQVDQLLYYEEQLQETRQPGEG